MNKFLIVGLGNPGKKYETTRHNVGFLAIDTLSKVHNTSVTTLKHKGLYGSYQENGNTIYLLKPMTYMNESGKSVGDFLSYFSIPVSNLLVLYDDISLPIGALRIRRKGSSGGHNGIKDIIRVCGTEEFHRVKIGVGEKPYPTMDLADWVLSSFSKEDLSTFSSTFDAITHITQLFMAQSLEKAMNLYQK